MLINPFSFLYGFLKAILYAVLFFSAGFLVGYFYNQQSVAESSYLLSVFSPGTEQLFYDLIDSAERSIDIEVYSFTHTGLAEKLISANSRGVVIRVLLDGEISQNELRIVNTLKRNGIGVRFIKLENGYMHAKYMIIDGKKVFVGSINFSRNALLRNREAAVIIEDKKIVGEFARVFEQDWRYSKESYTPAEAEI